MRNSYLQPEASVVQGFEASLAGKSDEELREVVDANARLYNTVFGEAEASLDFSKVKALGGTDDEKRDKLSNTIAERTAATNLLRSREDKAEADQANEEAVNAIRRRGPRTFSAEQVNALVSGQVNRTVDGENVYNFFRSISDAVHSAAGGESAVAGPETFRRMLANRAVIDTGMAPRNLLRDPSEPLNQITATQTMRTGTGVTTAQAGTGFLTLPPLQQDVEYLSRRMTSVFAFLAARAMELPANAQGAYRYTAETAPARTGGAGRPAARAQAGSLQRAKYNTELRTVPLTIMGQWVPVAVEEFLDVPMFQDFLSTVMREDLLLSVDADLITGDGSSNKVTGLLEIPDASTTTAQTGTSQAPTFGVTQIHSDIWEKVYGVGNAYADAIVMHPNDWHAAITQRDSQDRLLVGNTFDPAAQTLFGLQVIKNTALPAGNTITFASNKVRLITQGGVMVDTTNSHDDGFEKMIDAVRMWVRLGLMSRRDTAVAKTTGWAVKKTS